MSGNGKQGSKWIRKDRRLALYLRDEFRCAYCERDLHHASREEVTLDHLIPRVEGGTNANENLVTACLHCNSQRADAPWREYAPAGAIERIERTITKPINRDLAKAILSGYTPLVEALR